jgi:type IV pilus assembly protein PilX
MHALPTPLPRQHGATLFVTLCIVMVLMMMGVSAVRTALNAERSARGDRDHQIALQAAEAALEDAERDIEGGATQDAKRAAMFAPGSSAGFVHGCGAGANQGLCLRSAAPPAWQSAGLGDDGARTVEYGRFTGAAMPHGSGALPARLPRYVIELMPYARAGHDAGTRTGNFYRITAIGFGASASTRVVLQSFYLKEEQA